jgi:hypothetical protein
MIKTAREVSPGGADPIGAAAALSDEEIAGRFDGLFCQKAAVEGSIVVLLGEVARRQAYRSEGATSTEPWAVERFGVSVPTERAITRLGEKAWDIPHLVESLCAGELSLDKVRAVAEVATPESDRQLAGEAKECSVRQLGEIARRSSTTRPSSHPEDDRRSVRFNDQCRTLSVQLLPAPYAETRACLEARARSVPIDAETPWDERIGDTFVELIGSTGQTGSATTTSATPSPYVVVVHVPLAALVEESGRESALPVSSNETASSTSRTCASSPSTPASPSTTTSATPCTRAGSAIAASRAAPTPPSPMSTTSCPGDPADARTSTISRSCACTTITWCIRRDGR